VEQREVVGAFVEKHVCACDHPVAEVKGGCVLVWHSLEHRVVGVGLAHSLGVVLVSVD
jgi:hypothetical protein